MVKAIAKYFFPVAFLSILLLPVLNGGFSIWKFERSEENRTFHDSISISLNKLDNFPTEFEAYYNDNFSFRTPLLDFYHKIKFHAFNVSPDEDQLIIGRDGWYFLGGVEKEIYEGRRGFSRQELELFTSEWKSRLAYLQSKNIKTYWIICPTKHQVYKDKLPFNVLDSDQPSRTSNLIKHLHKELPPFVMDPTAYLTDRLPKHKLYFQLDNHWNLRAGNIVTEFILKNMRKDFPDLSIDFLDNYTWKDTVKRDGIHYATIGIKDLFEYNEIPVEKELNAHEATPYGFPPIPGFPYPWDYERRYENKKSGKLKILIIRDSFGDAIMPFLKEPFSESVFIFDAWQYRLDKEIIEKVNPDIVLYLSLETHIENIIAK